MLSVLGVRGVREERDWEVEAAVTTVPLLFVLSLTGLQLGVLSGSDSASDQSSHPKNDLNAVLYIQLHLTAFLPSVSFSQKYSSNTPKREF